MKKFLSYILISLIIGANLLAPISVGISGKKGIEINKNEVSAAGGCTFVSATFSPSTDTTSKNSRPKTTTLTIETTGCTGMLFDGFIRASAWFASTGIPYLIINPTQISSDNFSLLINTGEADTHGQSCNSGTCEARLDINLKDLSGAVIKNFTSTARPGSNDFLSFACDTTTCDKTKTWSVVSTETQGLNQVSTWSINPAVTSNTVTISGIGPIQIQSPTPIASNFTTSDNLIVNLYNTGTTTPAAPEQVINIMEKFLSNGAITYTVAFEGLQPQTGYDFKLTTRLGSQSMNGIYTVTTANTTFVPLPIDTSNRGTAQNTDGGNNDGQPICWISLTKGFQVSGCIAQGMYYLFFKPTSFVFAFAGQFLDMIFMYSISDTSYRSTFVVEGWGVVRDFCNMFFIFVLLYIAFKTILGLGASKTKEMVINVVIIGLLINFSLFATQVIIDASNILARVFYNQNTIVTGPKATGSGIVSSVLGPFGEIQLSSAVVAKVNPQELLMKSTTAGITQAKPRGVLTDTYAGDIDPGTFIITVLLATAVNVVGTIAFLSSALIFLGRVIMLWLAMILVPIAFFSYTIPALQDVKMIGWKKWWPDTLKMAFVAPVFAFFMYLIVGFLDKGLGIANATGKNGMAFVIAIVVPFVFIMILLMKAKDVAVSMSGEVGAAMSKAGAAVGGLALGAATGGAAMLGRASIGKLGDKLDKSTWVNKLAGGNNLFSKFAGNKLKDIGQGVSKSSFDVRAIKLGSMAGKGMDIDMGKAKEGGYTKDRKDKVERKQKRAGEIKVNEDEKLNQDINKAEIDLQGLLNQTTKDFETIDKTLIALRQKKSDATTIADKDAITTLINAEVLKKDNLKNGLTIGGAPGGAVVVGGSNAGKTIKQMEVDVIPKAKNAKLTESRRRTTHYANGTAWWGGKANKEAQHKIIMEDKLDSGTKT